MGGPPFKRRSGPDYVTPAGEVITPLAFMHPCEAEGCEKHGGFGFAVNLRRGIPGHWYCLDHKHLGEALYASATHLGDHGAKGDRHEPTPAHKRPERR